MNSSDNMQHSGPGFARVDPLRGRVSSSLKSEVRKTINHKRSRGNLSAQQSTETGQLQNETQNSISGTFKNTIPGGGTFVMVKRG